MEYGDDEQPRLRAADLERLAAEHRAVLEEEGHELHPVVSRSRKLATSFWGSAWMRQLACCEAGGLCLAPGRTLLRHACVLDVRISPGVVKALVSSDAVYEVTLCLDSPDEERVEALAERCRGEIDSLMALLEGKMSEALAEQLCEPEAGLLPEARDWHISCTCADWSEPCVHAAAAMYAVGVLLDADASLLFTLRDIPMQQLLRQPEVEAEEFNMAELEKNFGIQFDL